MLDRLITLLTECNRLSDQGQMGLAVPGETSVLTSLESKSLPGFAKYWPRNESLQTNKSGGNIVSLITLPRLCRVGPGQGRNNLQDFAQQ